MIWFTFLSTICDCKSTKKKSYSQIKSYNFMKTKRNSWNFLLGFGIHHLSETDIWTIYKMPTFEEIAIAHSLRAARLRVAELASKMVYTIVNEK